MFDDLSQVKRRYEELAYRMTTPEAMNDPADGEINYNPKDYEEYPDFPQSMLEPKYSPYQTV